MALLGRPEAQGLAHDVKEAISMVVAERDDLVGRWGFLSVLTEMNAADFWAHAMQYLARPTTTFSLPSLRLGKKYRHI
jgi:hypothetical protein